jgi:subfamily B ATP-binding cassette protein MsbA
MKKKLSWSVVWREAGALVAAHRRRLLLGLALLVVGRIASLVLPGSAGWLIDHVVHDKQAELLWPLALAVLAATLVQAASSFALSQLLGIAGQQAINDLRQRVYEHVLRLPVSRFDATQSGTLISRIMSDAEGIRNLVGTGIVQLVGGLLTGVAVLVWLFVINWQLTAAIAVLLAIFGAFTAIAFKRLRPLFKERQKFQGEISGALGQILGGIRIVKVFTAEERLGQRFAADTGRLFAMIRATMTGFSQVTALTIVVMGVAGCLFILIGGPAMARGDMTVGNAFQYVFLVGLLAGPIGQIASISTQFTEAFAGLDRIRELTAHAHEVQGPQSCPRLLGEVEFRDVTFGYDPARPVLTEVSLHAQAGQTIALVGPSGAGKTTLISLLLAFIRPQRGEILVDGIDLAQLQLSSYRRQIGVVLQDNWLFDGTVVENLRFARPEASLDEVVSASRLAAADTFIRGLANGYETVIGERGVKLSGGQRQRLAIARALLADPRILILDEATSSLDSESEAEIQAALATLRSGRTTFVIAHRLSTIRAAQQILVIENGGIAERGTHDELLQRDGTYRRLHDRQHAVAAEQHINPGEELRV